MLSFQHPNVMSLIGVCLDREIPLLIMPFMSNGSVLEYVKNHKKKLLLSSETEEKDVCYVCLYGAVYYILMHTCIFIHYSHRYKPLKILFWVCAIKSTRGWLI